MSADQGQEHGMGQPAALPRAGGPPVNVALTDGRHPVRRGEVPLPEPDSSRRYGLQIHLPGRGTGHVGRAA
ncbi:hypothetical protein [Actinacidiphila sp. ITFR-21]|uniref:hypothetical protein n=1 Tax=Actinacidiphila sp. ITFR-21 TaxID=3075199 RepID=UPI00288AF390|nr:hypothetical protein [Streptomyces sp. ITFR-21]WNI14221.1 hypothetical protein RLT57_00875 [Streptomyces sp. ITFR-21]